MVLASYKSGKNKAASGTMGDHSAGKGSREVLKEFAGLWLDVQPAISKLVTLCIVDFHDAEDVLQEITLRLADRFESYDSSRPFEPWALRIARNCVNDYFRRKGRSTLVFSSQLVAEFATAVEKQDGQAAERKAALRFCLDKLAGQAMQVVRLRYLECCAVNDIAGRLRISENAVYITLHRARQALSRCISQHMTRIG